MKTPRLLIFAYACEPSRGSEPGAGWAMVQAALDFAECTVLVASEHVEGLSKWKHVHPESPLEIVEVEPARFADRLSRSRIGRFVAYLRWCRRARTAAEHLMRTTTFDAAWHVTFSVYWLPSPIRHLSLPAIWGPVGGAVHSPWQLMRGLSPSGIALEIMDAVTVRIVALWPSTRQTWRRANAILVQNPETLRRLPRRIRSLAHTVNHAEFLVVDPPPAGQREVSQPPELVWIGAMETRKRPDLALHALERTPPDVRMSMIGDGPQMDETRRRAAELNLLDRLTFVGLIPRDAALARLVAARGAVFTGSREEGGLALAEALALGTPCVVLAHGGAGTIASRTASPLVAEVSPQDWATTCDSLGSAMTSIYRDGRRSESSLLGRTEAMAMLRTAVLSAVASVDHVSDSESP